MFWIWLLGLITFGLLIWFGMQVFSGGVSPQSDGTNSELGGGGTGGHGQNAISNNSDSTNQGASGHGSSDSASAHGGAGSASSGSASAHGGAGSGSSASASGQGGSSSASSTTSMGAVAAAGAAVAAGGAAVGGAAAARARAKSRPRPSATDAPIVYDNVSSGADISASGNGKTGHAAGVSQALSSSEAEGVREMIKILNLRESDASRLGIDASQFAGLWQGSTDSVDASTLTSV